MTAILKLLLLGRGRRRNLLTWTEDLSKSVWTNVVGGTGSAPVKTPGFTDPDGGAGAWRIQCNRGAGNTSSDYSIVRNANSVLAAATGTMAQSCYVKSNTGSSQTFAFSAGAGLVTATTEWTRVTATQVSPTRFDFANFGPAGGTASLDILVYHPQIELGTTATKYQRINES